MSSPPNVVDIVNPEPPAVLPVTAEPALTVIALIATVYALEASCVIFKVKDAAPFAGTLVKSISVTASVKVKEPTFPFAKSIATAPEVDDNATSVS